MALPAGCFAERQGRVGAKGLPEGGAPGRSLDTRSAHPGEEMRVSRQPPGPWGQRGTGPCSLPWTLSKGPGVAVGPCGVAAGKERAEGLCWVRDLWPGSLDL